VCVCARGGIRKIQEFISAAASDVKSGTFDTVRWPRAHVYDRLGTDTRTHAHTDTPTHAVDYAAQDLYEDYSGASGTSEGTTFFCYFVLFFLLVPLSFAESGRTRVRTSFSDVNLPCGRDVKRISPFHAYTTHVFGDVSSAGQLRLGPVESGFVETSSIVILLSVCHARYDGILGSPDRFSFR